MIARGSRYEFARRFVAAADQKAAFGGVRARAIDAATPVVEHSLCAWDRLDLLALHYYNDARKWWRIVDANPEILCGADISDAHMVGTVILIPAPEETGGAS